MAVLGLCHPSSTHEDACLERAESKQRNFVALKGPFQAAPGLSCFPTPSFHKTPAKDEIFVGPDYGVCVAP